LFENLKSIKLSYQKGGHYNMRRKKIVSMLLVTIMAATLFAGCGNDSLMHSLLYRDLK